MERLIYGLIDPTTREMRYVGSSTKGLVRPMEHLRPCAYEKSSRRVYHWIRELVCEGHRPEIVLIEFVQADVNLIDCETGWIRYFRNIGCQLTNATGRAGGTGMTGKRHSDETKRRISEKKTGAKMSDAARKNIGAAVLGRRYHEDVRRRMGVSKIGKVRSEETRAKCADALSGIKHSEGRKKNTSTAMKKWWEERRGRV